MRFVWDSRKSDINAQKRAFDFAFATLVFDGPTLEREDTRYEYGERRIVATGIVDGMYLTVVYTDRFVETETIRRIISARESSRGERKAYDETY